MLNYARLIPNNFSITNQMPTELKPGLHYYFNAVNPPVRSQWYKTMQNFAREGRFAGTHTVAPIASYLSKVTWRQHSFSTEDRDKLQALGHNYVGVFPTFNYGVGCYGAGLVLKDNSFHYLMNVMPLIMLLHQLDSTVEVLRRLGTTGQAWIYQVAYNLNSLSQLFISYQQVYNFTFVWSGPTNLTVMIVPVLGPTALGTIEVSEGKNGKARLQFNDVFSYVPEALKLLYLPGTMEFKNLEI